MLDIKNIGMFVKKRLRLKLRLRLRLTIYFARFAGRAMKSIDLALGAHAHEFSPTCRWTPQVSPEGARMNHARIYSNTSLLYAADGGDRNEVVTSPAPLDLDPNAHRLRCGYHSTRSAICADYVMFKI
jgi:hypothetical protein